MILYRYIYIWRELACTPHAKIYQAYTQYIIASYTCIEYASVVCNAFDPDRPTHLGEDDLGVDVLDLLCRFRQDRRQLLAVAAPWSQHAKQSYNPTHV